MQVLSSASRSCNTQRVEGVNQRKHAVARVQAVIAKPCSICQPVPALRPVHSANRAVCQAASAAAAATPKQSQADKSRSVELAIALLEEATAKGTVPGAQVIKALSTLEKAKLPAGDWPSKLGSGPSGGSRWRLIFTSDQKQTKGVMKGESPLLPGVYFPIPAVQRWDGSKKEIENGVFLGHIAALTFRGGYSWKKNIMTFTFKTLRLRLGPKWFDFNIAPKDESKKPVEGLFSFLIVNDTICAARGKAGGYGLWRRTDPSWEVSAGIP